MEKKVRPRRAKKPTRKLATHQPRKVHLKTSVERKCLRCEKLFTKKAVGQFMCSSCRRYNLTQEEDDDFSIMS